MEQILYWIWENVGSGSQTLKVFETFKVLSSPGTCDRYYGHSGLERCRIPLHPRLTPRAGDRTPSKLGYDTNDTNENRIYMAQP